MTLEITDLKELPKAAHNLLAFAGNERIFLFYGGMGAGKTTFIKALCRKLGIIDLVSSPTFSIVNEYTSPSGPVYHFDFYRLRSETEALDLGYEDYIYSGCYCFVEWPEKISGLLPENACSVEIEIEGSNSRKLTVQKI